MFKSMSQLFKDYAPKMTARRVAQTAALCAALALPACSTVPNNWMYSDGMGPATSIQQKQTASQIEREQAWQEQQYYAQQYHSRGGYGAQDPRIPGMYGPGGVQNTDPYVDSMFNYMGQYGYRPEGRDGNDIYFRGPDGDRVKARTKVNLSGKKRTEFSDGTVLEYNPYLNGGQGGYKVYVP